MRKSLILFFILLAIIFSCKKNDSNNEIKTEIISFEGIISIKDINNNEIPAKAGLKLSRDYLITTGDKSSIEIGIGEKQILRIKEKSQIVLKDLISIKDNENVKLNLAKGSINVKSKKLNEGSKFEVETETIACGIRGTEFIVDVTEKSTRVSVTEGTVSVKKIYKIDKLDDLEKYDKNLSDKVNKSLDNQVIVDNGKTLIIDNADLDEENKKINDIVYEMNTNTIEKKSNDENLKKMDNVIKQSELTPVTTISDESINEDSKSLNDSTLQASDNESESLKKSKNEKTKLNNKKSKTNGFNGLIEKLVISKKLSIKTIDISPSNNIFTSVTLQTADNEIECSRLTVYYTDGSHKIYSENFILKKGSTPHTIKIPDGLELEKIRITAICSERNATLEIFGYNK